MKKKFGRERKKNSQTKRYYFSIATIGLKDGILFVCHAHTMGSLLAQQSYIQYYMYTVSYRIVSYRILSPVLCNNNNKEIRLQPEEKKKKCIHTPTVEKISDNANKISVEIISILNLHYFGIILAFVQSFGLIFYIEIYCLYRDCVLVFLLFIKWGWRRKLLEQLLWLIYFQANLTF